MLFIPHSVDYMDCMDRVKQNGLKKMAESGQIKHEGSKKQVVGLYYKINLRIIWIRYTRVANSMGGHVNIKKELIEQNSADVLAGEEEKFYFYMLRCVR